MVKYLMLSEDSKNKIESWVKKFPKGKEQSALIPALTIAQEQNDGFLTTDIINDVADFLKVPKIKAYEVASFYSMYNLEPVGKNIIYLCTNLSCMLCGSEKIADYIQKKLNIGFNETTNDGMFTLKEIECLAACQIAPAMLLNKKYYGNLTEEKVDKIIAEVAADA